MSDAGGLRPGTRVAMYLVGYAKLGCEICDADPPASAVVSFEVIRRAGPDDRGNWDARSEARVLSCGSPAHRDAARARAEELRRSRPS